MISRILFPWLVNEQAYGFIARAVPKFVRSSTEFVDISVCCDERCKMWALLGIPEEMLGVVVHVNPQ